MSEIELKFGVPEQAIVAIERALRRRGGRARTIESHYWDSADRRLTGAGVSLRLRKAGGRWEQTVKAAGPSPAERVEETVPRPGRWDPGGPPADPGLHAGTPAEPLLRAALASRGSAAPLGPVFTSVVKRLALEIDVAEARIEIAFDRGAIDAGDRSLPLCEVEAELKQGDVARAGRRRSGRHRRARPVAVDDQQGGARQPPRRARTRRARSRRGRRSCTRARAAPRSSAP